VAAGEPRLVLHEALDRLARRRAREGEGDEAAGDGAAEREKRARKGAEGQTACGGEDVPGEHRRREHDPGRQRGQRRGRPGAREQPTQARRRVWQQERRGGRPGERDDDQSSCAAPGHA
jgi:hypothetical protein